MDGGHPQDYPGKSGVGEQCMSFSFISQVILLLIICKCHQFDPHDKALRILRIAFIFLITLRLVNNLFKRFLIINHLSRFVIVTAEYNCSLPPALTNLFDYFPPASFRQRVFVFCFFVLVFSLCVLSLLLSAFRQFKTRYVHGSTTS